MLTFNALTIAIVPLVPIGLPDSMIKISVALTCNKLVIAMKNSFSSSLEDNSMDIIAEFCVSILPILTYTVKK